MLYSLAVVGEGRLPWVGEDRPGGHGRVGDTALSSTTPGGLRPVGVTNPRMVVPPRPKNRLGVNPHADFYRYSSAAMSARFMIYKEL